MSISVTEQIRRSRRELLGSVEELGTLAGRVAAGNRGLWLAVDRALRDLKDALARHHALESRALGPILTAGNGWGMILARHLASVHRSHVSMVDEALHLEHRDARERGLRVRVLGQLLCDDIRQEQGWLDRITTAEAGSDGR